MSKPRKEKYLRELSSGNYPIADTINPESVNTGLLRWTTTTGTTTAASYYCAADSITSDTTIDN